LAILEDYEPPLVKGKQIISKDNNQNDVWDIFLMEDTQSKEHELL